mmetsp:Transcript_10764/g.19538  ORF Transcript_10764/g.19538 Transcript_10764/m.19538 type:complete len:125 (-) Transcript_10764:130-504(-)
MPLLNRMSRERPKVRWAFVYTLEAHAADEWPITSARYEPSKKPVCISQHRSDEERLRAMRHFQAAFKVPFPVVADSIQGHFESLFCTWPFRFYVLRGKRVFWRAQPKNCTYELEELVRVLDSLS